ncbi:hypothetical protein niasHT_037566 [Heterodera trifolii]|uniref:Uncharacterized protein n=1 Tax=Heterodera trifolii TaxID=157864 RepID=A0ABD2HNR1_9BILA
MPNFARRTGGPPCHQKRMAARVAIHLVKNFYTPGGTETTAANSGHSANARRGQKHRVFKLKGNVEMNEAERTANEELDDVINNSVSANAINGRINGDEAAATVSDGGASADNCERAAVVSDGLNSANANANNGTNAVTAVALNNGGANGEGEAAALNNGGANADNGEGETATVNDGDANVDNGTNAETEATAQNNGLEGNANNGTNGANPNAQHRKRPRSGAAKRRAKERSAAHPRPPAAATANPVPTSLNMPFPMMMMMPFPMMMPFNFPFPPPPPPPAQQQQQQ